MSFSISVSGVPILLSTFRQLFGRSPPSSCTDRPCCISGRPIRLGCSFLFIYPCLSVKLYHEAAANTEYLCDVLYPYMGFYCTSRWRILGKLNRAKQP